MSLSRTSYIQEKVKTYPFLVVVTYTGNVQRIILNPRNNSYLFRNEIHARVPVPKNDDLIFMFRDINTAAKARMALEARYVKIKRVETL